MSLPASKNIAIYKGDSWRLAFTLKDPTTGDPVNLTGSTVSAEIRATEDSGTVMAEMDASHDGTGGTVTLELTPVQTSGLSANGVWDVQLVFPDGWVQTYLKGTVTLVKEVTRV